MLYIHIIKIHTGMPTGKERPETEHNAAGSWYPTPSASKVLGHCAMSDCSEGRMEDRRRPAGVPQHPNHFKSKINGFPPLSPRHWVPAKPLVTAGKMLQGKASPTTQNAPHASSTRNHSFPPQNSIPPTRFPYFMPPIHITQLFQLQAPSSPCRPKPLTVGT
jgi:hypothetical protein